MSASSQKRTYTRVPELCLRLKQLALSREPHARLPTLPELCELLGTSIATLNEVLGHLEAQQVIYRQHGRGIFVSPHLFRTGIGIIFNAYWLALPGTSPFWGSLLGCFAQEALQRKQVRTEDHAFHLIIPGLNQGSDLPPECTRMVQEQRLQGVLCISVLLESIEWLQSQGVPCISFAGPGDYEVRQDQQELVCLGVAYLLEQGCRHIQLWGGKETRSSSYVEPFQALLNSHGLEYSPEQVCAIPDEVARLTTREQGHYLVEQVFNSSTRKKPDGVIIIDDLITEGAIDAFHKSGITIGEDLFIACHGNRGSMLLFNHIPGLQVIDFDPLDIAQEMFHLLDIVLLGQEPPEKTVFIKPSYRIVSPGS